MAEPQEVETAIGPGSEVELGVDPKPRLEGVGDYNFVEILNPLSVTFVGQAALTTNVAAPMPMGKPGESGSGLTNSEADVRQIYGFDLRAQAQQSGKTHIINRIPIESGKTVNLMGGEAKVVLGQLVSTVMQREGKTHLLANMHERRAVEDRLVQKVGNLQEMMGRNPLSVQEQLKTTLDSLNAQPTEQITQGVEHEPEFPGLTPDGGTGTGPDSGQSDQGQSASDTPPKRGPGRPPAQRAA